MTINLPKLNQTGKNEWADVEDNDVALKEAIEEAQEEIAALSGFAWKTKAIATEQERTNAEYDFLTTGDKIEGLVVPENGALEISYSALWKESVAGTARAAIFIGANQLKIPQAGAAPGAQAGRTGGGGTTFVPLITGAPGLVSLTQGEANSSFVTTGMSLALANTEGYYDVGGTIKANNPGGPTRVSKLAAGTYTVGIKFKASEGTVTVKERLLQVALLG